ncbi:DoxX family protein [Microbacteriaceae bacterium 4G12]
MKKSYYELGGVFLRIVLGIIFIVHGFMKFQGLSGVAGWFESIHVPGFVAYIVAPIELVGGVFLLVGLLTRYVSLLLTFIMIGAIFTFKLSIGFVGANGLAGYEMDLAIMAGLVHLFLSGSQLLAVDKLLQKNK